MTEQTLRERLHQRADEAPDRPLDYADIWDAAVRRRRRRTRRATTAVVITALAAVGVSALWGGSDPTSDDPTNHQQRNDRSDSKAGTALEAWIASLPVGELPTKPYMQGSVMHDGEIEWSIRGRPYSFVLDRVPGGYLVQSDFGPDHKWRFGVRDASGDVFWLGSPEFDPLEVLSTDHTRLAVVAGSDIRLYDLEQRSEIASLQADGYVEPIQLVDAGLVYAVYNDGPDQVYLWNPNQGGSPEVLHYQPDVVSDDMTRALVYRSRSPCWRAVDVEGANVVGHLFESCKLERTYTISPDGTHALTVDRKVVDLDSGQVSAFEGAPNRGAVMPYAVWEDSEHVLLRLPLNNSGSRLYGKAPTVRCSVIDLTCERIPEDDGPSIRVLDATRTP